MRLFVICIVLTVALAADHTSKNTEKRGADIQYATVSPKPNYATATPSVVTAVTTVSPSYSSKTLHQPYLKSSLVQQPVAYEHVSQPLVKYAFASQPAQAYRLATPVTYTAQAQHLGYQSFEQPQINYVQPQDVKYVTQSVGKLVAAPPKIQYTAPASVAYHSAEAPAAFAVSGPVVQPHYSPAGSVSSFHFSNPHVTYSNLGLLSQVVGKGFAGPQATHVVSPQVTYTSAAPAAAQSHYVSAGHHVPYSSPQVQISAAPQVQPTVPTGVAYHSPESSAVFVISDPVLQQHHSPVGTDSNFHFKTYSNVGLLSEVLTKGFSVPQTAHNTSPQVDYTASVASATPQPHYVIIRQHVLKPSSQIQTSNNPQVHSHPTVPSQQYSPVSRQYLIVPLTQYLKSAHSVPQHAYSLSATKTLPNLGISYAH